VEAIVLRRELSCATAPSALFVVLADLDRLYRMLGQPTVSREPIVGEGSARFVLRGRTGPKAIPFTELPPQWNAPGLLVSKRVLHQGLLASVSTRFTLTPQMQGTQLLIEMQLEPRVPQIGWLIRLYGQGTLWHLARTLAKIDAGLQRGTKVQQRLADFVEPSLASAVTKTKAALTPEEQPLVDSLLALLRRTDDLDIDSLRLPMVCEALGQSEPSVMRLLLLASAHGLLQPSFDVLCPSCRSPASQHDHLGELSDESFCALCELRVPVEFASNVEVTFRPSLTVRSLSRPLYTSVNPSASPHVLTQLVLPASSSVQFHVPNEPGAFRLWARGGASGVLKVSTLGPQQASITVTDFKLERTEWTAQRLDGHKLTLHPLFRQLFPSELPKPLVQLSIPSVSLWQCEFASMGELCSALGDSGAFRQLLELQQAVEKAIAAESGAVLHSVASGLVAAFSSSESALRAAVLAQRAVMTLRADNPFAHLLGMRLGLYTGSASVVDQDRRLDYFGQTVAICARLASEAHSGDILLPSSMLSLCESIPGVKAGPIFSIVGKGLSSAVSVSRLSVEMLS
jgi:class 3 adenylate cyclase